MERTGNPGNSKIQKILIQTKKQRMENNSPLPQSVHYQKTAGTKCSLLARSAQWCGS